MRFTVRGVPPRKNDRHALTIRGGRPVRYNAPAYKDFAKRLAAEVRGLTPIGSGLWDLHVVAYWPRWRHLDQSVPYADADAPISCLLDAMQDCGLIDDDMRIMSVTAEKRHSDDPRLDVEITAVAPHTV